jgi:SagB-type dehydrogenase family enzyme
MTGKGALMALLGSLLLTSQPAPPEKTATIALPKPAATGAVSLEQALAGRRSVRSFSSDPLSLEEVSLLLWAAQGVTDPDGGRTAPSAGALYPLEILLVAGAVEGLAAGVYRYRPGRHALERAAAGDRRATLAAAARGQEWVRRAAAVLVAAGVPRRTAARYGARAPRYVWLEAGSAGQNVYLEATALGLATVMVGAFDDAAVGRALGLAPEEEPLWLMPVGRRRG